MSRSPRQSKVEFTATPWDLGKTVTATQDSYAVVNLMGRYDFDKQLSAILNAPHDSWHENC